MFNTRTLQGIIILIAGLFLAVWLGLSIATNQVETIIQVVAAAVLIGCLFIGKRIWLLVPLMGALNLQLRIPGQPDSLLLAQILVICFCTLLFLMRRLPAQLKITELESLAIVLLLFVGQAYVRNPVGFSIFGGDTVGGKPYILFAIATVTAFLLSSLRVPDGELRLILPLGILGGCLNAAISIAGYFIPAVGFYTGATLARTDVTDYTNAGVAIDKGNANRIMFLTTLGRNLALWVGSFKSPFPACFHPFWGGLILASLAAAMLGGFRNGVAAVGLTYLVAIAYRNGIGGTMLALFGGSAAIGLLAFVNLVAPLPPNIQRTLTFLPGTWEQRYKDDAAGSTDWRVEIWKEVLLTERWIQNKIIGDGLGFSAVELAAQMNYRKGTRAGISGFDIHRESVLANGDYHSGPVSMIRTIGYVGLLFFVIAQLRLAVHAHRQIIRCRGTPWLPLALFIGIPIIWAPVFFLFIFGDFKMDMGMLLLGIGMVRLLENNLPLDPWKSRHARIIPLRTGKPAHISATASSLP
jgi:hypothetical protein